MAAQMRGPPAGAALSDADRSGQNGPSVSTKAHFKQTPTAAHWSVTEGRVALGTVQYSGGAFVATDTAGTCIGRFTSMREAARSFSGRAR
jgi:hypothetical protein